MFFIRRTLEVLTFCKELLKWDLLFTFMVNLKLYHMVFFQVNDEFDYKFTPPLSLSESVMMIPKLTFE